MSRSVVQRIHAEVDRRDRLLGNLVAYGVEPMPEKEVIVSENIATVGEAMVFSSFWTAWFAGVAVVHLAGNETSVAIGTLSNMELFIKEWSRVNQSDVTARNMQAELAVTPTELDTKLAASHQAREHRIGLLRIQHKVCQFFPTLREWRAPKNAEHEVVLRSNHGGLRLGGVVWVPSVYTSDEGRKFLGFDCK